MCLPHEMPPLPAFYREWRALCTRQSRRKAVQDMCHSLASGTCISPQSKKKKKKKSSGGPVLLCYNVLQCEGMVFWAPRFALTDWVCTNPGPIRVQLPLLQHARWPSGSGGPLPSTVAVTGRCLTTHAIIVYGCLVHSVFSKSLYSTAPPQTQCKFSENSKALV